MCLIVAHKAGAKPLQFRELGEAWQSNPDGAGFMYAAEGKLWIRKAFFKLKELAKGYYEDLEQYGAESPFVLHFRSATHGAKTEGNTHPFFIGQSGVGMAHNGVLWSPGRDVSDSKFFADTVLAHRSLEQLYSEKFQGFLAEIIGMGNKLALLAHTGEMRIVNEARGFWEGETWFSNRNHRYQTYSYPAQKEGKKKQKGGKVGEKYYTYGKDGAKYVSYRDEKGQWRSVRDNSEELFSNGIGAEDLLPKELKGEEATTPLNEDTPADWDDQELMDRIMKGDSEAYAILNEKILQDEEEAAKRASRKDVM